MIPVTLPPEETIEIPDILQVLTGADQPQPGFGTFRILSIIHGDKRITWNARVMAEIAAAKDLFLKLIKEGLVPYKVGLNGQSTAEVLKEFDAFAEEIIFLPVALVGGG